MPQSEQLKPKVEQNIEKPPERVESSEKRIETPKDLSEFGKQRASQVKETSSKVIEFGSRQIGSAIASIGGWPEVIKAGNAAIAKVQQGIRELSLNTQEQIGKASQVEKSSRVEKERKISLKDNYTPKQLGELRAKTKENYGEGLVSKHHKGVETLAGHEAAQKDAYRALEGKIEAGVVKPDSIHSDILNRLELRDNPEIRVENVSQIAERTSSELKDLTEKGLIKEDEAALIQAEAEKFTQIYVEAFPDAYPQQVFKVAMDNIRKLVYQTERDKQVFSGSDHGTRHILEGNMKMADRIIESLGDKSSSKDKILIHQIIIDHDLGYTIGAAQAKESFDASKDHPLFSAKFIEANQEYYTQMFSKDGYEVIHNGILQHSYPKSEYGTPTNPEKGFNPDIIRSVTSTVDALGVTSETKCPAFFRNPESINVLQKVKLYADTHEGKVSPDTLAMYKNQLREIADKEPDADRRDGYYNAIENQFNPVTVEMTLGQYAGVLKDIKITEREGKMVPYVNMDISRVQALLGDIFGDKVAIKVFVKAMEDFGVPKEAMADMAKTLRQIKKAKTDKEKLPLMERLKYSSDKAVFEFAPEFAEVTSEIEKSFEKFARLTIRDKIRELSHNLELPEARTPEKIGLVFEEFNTAIGEQVDEEDLTRIMEIQKEIRNNIDTPENFDKTLENFNTFITKKEKEFMGI